MDEIKRVIECEMSAIFLFDPESEMLITKIKKGSEQYIKIKNNIGV